MPELAKVQSLIVHLTHSGLRNSIVLAGETPVPNTKEAFETCPLVACHLIKYPNYWNDTYEGACEAA
jgi:hypothetical protein